MEEIICKEPDLEKFVKEQTNLGDYFKKTKQPKEITAKKCYTSLFRWIVRPEGSVFPCVMCATQNNKKIGSIFEDSLKVLQEESFKFYHYEKCTTNDCCKIGQGVQNDIFEQSLDSSEIKYESNDFFI
ncbi:SPASM domain-containing protein [Enterococcus termitis]